MSEYKIDSKQFMTTDSSSDDDNDDGNDGEEKEPSTETTTTIQDTQFQESRHEVVTRNTYLNAIM